MKNALLVLMSLMTLLSVSVSCRLSSIEKITNEVVAQTSQQKSIDVKIAPDSVFPDIDQVAKSSLYETVAPYVSYGATALAAVGGIVGLRLLFQKYALSLVQHYPFFLRPIIFLASVIRFFLWNDENIKALATVMGVGAFAQYLVLQIINFITKNDTDIQSQESARVVVPGIANSLAGTICALNVVGVAALMVAIFFRFAEHRFAMAFGDDVSTHMGMAFPPVLPAPAAAAAA